MIITALPQIHFQTHEGRPQVVLKGSWAGQMLGEAELVLQKTLSQLPQSFDLDLTEATVDSNGAYLMIRLFQPYDYTSHGPQNVLSLLKSMGTFKLEPLPEILPRPWYLAILEKVGQQTCFLMDLSLNLIRFFGEIVVTLVTSIRNIRWKSVVRYSEDMGVKALGIVGLISFLIGTVLAYQGINQLSRFGAEIFTVDFLGIGILRELGVLLTSIVVAGRSASSIAAQIGIMKLNQEIDAIRMMGLNPMDVLVVPRVIALVITLPCLVFFSDMMGLLGGMVLTSAVIDLPPTQYLEQLQKAITPTHFWVGMSKAPLFALIIAIVGCFRGFSVKGSAESVGEMTTRAVVESIFLVIICDAILSVIYSYLKI
jgi:phospholipid/cholesterol/gamma-HCH transport system permease protein